MSEHSPHDLASDIASIRAGILQQQDPAVVCNSLLQSMASPAWQIRTFTVGLASRLPVRLRPYEAVVQTLASDEAGTRNAAVALLAQWGHQGIPWLESCYQNGDVRVRKMVLDAMRQLATQGAILDVSPYLQESDINLRLAAVEVLAVSRHHAACQQLIDLLPGEQAIELRIGILDALAQKDAIDAGAGLLDTLLPWFEERLLQRSLLQLCWKHFRDTASTWIPRVWATLRTRRRSDLLRQMLADLYRRPAAWQPAEDGLWQLVEDAEILAMEAEWQILYRWRSQGQLDLASLQACADAFDEAALCSALAQQPDDLCSQALDQWPACSDQLVAVCARRSCDSDTITANLAQIVAAGQGDLLYLLEQWSREAPGRVAVLVGQVLNQADMPAWLAQFAWQVPEPHKADIVAVLATNNPAERGGVSWPVFLRWVRNTGADTLLPSVSKALRHVDQDVRLGALQVLSQLAPDMFAEMAPRFLLDCSPEARYEVIQLAASVKSPALLSWVDDMWVRADSWEKLLLFRYCIALQRYDTKLGVAVWGEGYPPLLAEWLGAVAAGAIDAEPARVLEGVSHEDYAVRSAALEAAQATQVVLPGGVLSHTLQDGSVVVREACVRYMTAMLPQITELGEDVLLEALENETDPELVRLLGTLAGRLAA